MTRYRRLDARVICLVETNLGQPGPQVLAAAERRGLRPVVLTRSPGRYGATGPNIVEVDTAVVSSVVDAAAGLSAQAVLSTTDYGVLAAALAAAELRLPGPSPSGVAACRNKATTRQKCAAADIAVPRWVHVVDSGDTLAALAEVGLPCVVKPLAEAGSLQVRLCRTAQEAHAAVAALVDCAFDFRGNQRLAGALVEQYCVGPEVSVELCIDRGTVWCVGVTDKALGALPQFVELGETFPSALPRRVTQPLTELAAHAVAALGLDHGLAHVEIRRTADGPVLIEVNPRLAGALISELVLRATGIDLRDLALALALGEPIGLDGPRPSAAGSGAAASRYLVAPGAGTVVEVTGVEEARLVPGVVDVDLDVAHGDRVTAAEDNTGVVGHVVTVAPDPVEAAQAAETAGNQVRFVLDGAARA